jgi:hypothetical protein
MFESFKEYETLKEFMYLIILVLNLIHYPYTS